MPIDPPFDANDAWWSGPGRAQNGPLGGPLYPDYWNDPFINSRAVAPLAAPAPFSAAQLGAMAWHPPIFPGDWARFPAGTFPKTLGLSPPIPSAAPTSSTNLTPALTWPYAGLFSHNPSVPLGGGLFPYPLASNPDPVSPFGNGLFSAGDPAASAPMPGMPGASSAPAWAASLLAPPAQPTASNALFSHDPSLPVGGGLFPYPLGSDPDPTSPFGSRLFSAGGPAPSAPMPGMPGASSAPGWAASLLAPPAQLTASNALFPHDPSLPVGGGLSPYPLRSDPDPTSPFGSGLLSAGGPAPSAPMPGMPGASSAPGWPVPQSFLPTLPPWQSPFAVGGSTFDSPSSLRPSPTDSPAAPMATQRSVLFNRPQPDWDLGPALIARERNATALDSVAQGLGADGLPLSKSGVPYVSPSVSPQFSFEPPQWLDVARLLAPNIVDYPTKPPPPTPPFPPTPGKIPSEDNPYAPRAAIEAATWLALGLERGIVGPLVDAAKFVEKSATEAALQAAKSVVSARALARPAEQILSGPYSQLSGTLPPKTLDRILAALRAAVVKGNLTREQATALLQRTNAVGETGAAKAEGLLSSWLPKYDDKTTYGLLITNEGNVVPLRSGPPRSFQNYPPSKHMEGKGAIWIRENNSSGGVVYHNNTDGTCGLCDAQLERLLPHKAILDVVPPPDAIPKNAQAMAKPTWYIGDAIMPKLPPQARQPDFFGEQQ
jgi:hypothetical protein